jgi:hypothetical protein
VPQRILPAKFLDALTCTLTRQHEP